MLFTYVLIKIKIHASRIVYLNMSYKCISAVTEYKKFLVFP